MASCFQMAQFAYDPKRYPTSPGCYLMRDAAGRVLYVGKAVNLRRRLGSYFRAHSRDRKVRRLVPRTRTLEVILARNEVESLLLESNLIKYHKPPYNRKLVSDDTAYFRIALATSAPLDSSAPATAGALPRLVPYRELRINKQLGQDRVIRTFGPYVSRRFRDTLLDYVCETFGVRTCARLPRQVCLRYHLGRCCGVCEGHVTADAYARVVDRVTCFLSRPHDALIAQMRTQMQAAAQERQYERATRIRDQVRALESTLQRQVVDRCVDHDQAAIYLGPAHALTADVRRGKVIGVSLRDLGTARSPAAFLLARYGRARDCPPELIVNRLERPAEVARALSAHHGRPIEICVPQEGARCELLAFCERNYLYRVRDGRRRTTDDARSTAGEDAGARMGEGAGRQT
jgi:excinuclease ABC subunit C